MPSTPGVFLQQLRKSSPAPAYLFLGPEQYGRAECRRLLRERTTGADAGDDAFVRHDLDEVTLSAVIDDARSLSLFAAERLIWVSRAESALPRGRAAASSDDDDDSGKGRDSGAAELAAYLASPTPGVVLVFDSSRFEFDGEDKAKTERVRKFYAAIPNVVEFARLTDSQLRALANQRAQDLSLRIGGGELELLIEAVGGSAQALEIELEKLSHFCQGRPVTEADLELLTPQAQSTTIFALVNALGRRDRREALDLLDQLLRAGEYLPLALSFLGTQIRQAMVAQESGLKSASQVQAHFSRMGVPMWPSRAEQVMATARAFSGERLAEAAQRVARADRDLRDTRPDDRVVLEEFVVAVTRA
jgi:DNA polymerase-3 subunit delta